MKHHVLRLYEYHLWANKRVFEHLKALPRDIYEKEIQSVFPSISEALLHVYVVDNIWLSTMQGASFDETRALAAQLSNEAKGKNIEEMEKMFTDVSNRYIAFFHNQEDLEQVFSREHPRFGRLETRLFELNPSCC